IAATMRQVENIALSPLLLRRALVGPGPLSAKAEIVGVGFADGRARLGYGKAIGDAIALSVRYRLLLGVEGQPYLALHFARAGPPHQGLDLARNFGLILEHPFLGASRTGLHCGLRRLVYASSHVRLPPGVCSAGKAARTSKAPKKGQGSPESQRLLMFRTASY